MNLKKEKEVEFSIPKTSAPLHKNNFLKLSKHILLYFIEKFNRYVISW